MNRAELRIPMAGGQTLRVRITEGDPHWREKALSNLDPLAPSAFAIRKAKRTAAECAAWDEYCRLQTLIDHLNELTACVRELETALRELGDLE
jgi:hypothetical protein